MAKVAFIGVGNMGAPMARNLVKAGHEVHVFDIVATNMQSVQGAHMAEQAQFAVAGAPFVISMLPESRHVQSLYLGEKGLLAHIAPTALVIDCSTISAQASREVAHAAADRGIAMMDAPVSGGTNGAAAGTLTFMVGAQEEHLARARPLLEQMGKNIFHAGAPGAGQAAKLANNMLLGIMMAGTCEALALGVANGLDPKVLSDIMKQSSGGNWVLERYNPWPGVAQGVPAANHYAGGFGVDLMLKDLGLATEAAMASKSVTTLGEVARNLFALHSRLGHGKLDFSSILKTIQNHTD